MRGENLCATLCMVATAPNWHRIENGTIATQIQNFNFPEISENFRIPICARFVGFRNEFGRCRCVGRTFVRPSACPHRFRTRTGSRTTRSQRKSKILIFLKISEFRPVRDFSVSETNLADTDTRGEPLRPPLHGRNNPKPAQDRE